ncbi:MAG: hypothetical protein ACLQFR_20140 [Streptosporangiaceae bacterium]
MPVGALAVRAANPRPCARRHGTSRALAEDWPASGLPGRSAKTIRKNKDVLEPIVAAIGV